MPFSWLLEDFVDVEDLEEKCRGDTLIWCRYAVMYMGMNRGKKGDVWVGMGLCAGGIVCSF